MPIQNLYVPPFAQYIRQLTDKYIVTCICQLTNKYTRPTFVGVLYNCRFQKCSTVRKYKKPEERLV
jgi:hypothetical protein